MTNEEFINLLGALRSLSGSKDRVATTQLVEHARKLVAVAKVTAYMYDRIYLDRNEENFIVEAANMIKVREALENLEEGEG